MARHPALEAGMQPEPLLAIAVGILLSQHPRLLQPPDSIRRITEELAKHFLVVFTATRRRAAHLILRGGKPSR